jgi:hypothetical protein
MEVSSQFRSPAVLNLPEKPPVPDAWKAAIND